MAYSPDSASLDFDASLCLYSGGTDFDYACLGGNDLCLGGQPGGNDLNIGCWAPDEEPVGEDIACVVAATTKRPTSSCSVLNGRVLHVAATTRKPTARVLLAQIFPTTVHAVTRKPVANVQVADVRVVRVAASTRKPRCYTDLAYDPNLLSGVVGPTSDDWHEGRMVDRGAPSASTDAQRMSAGALDLGRDAGLCSESMIALWQPAERLEGACADEWADAPGMRQQGDAAWMDAPLAVQSADTAWREGLRLAGSSLNAWKQWLPHRAPYPFGTGPNDFNAWSYQDYPPAGDAVDFPGEFKRDNRPPRNGSAQIRFAGGVRQTAWHKEPFSDGAWLPSSCDENSWNDGAWVGYVRRIPPVWERPQPPWTSQGNDLNLCYRAASGNDLDLGSGCQRRIPRRGAYRVINVRSVTRLSDGEPIQVKSISIDLDSDSWVARWSATLGSALSELEKVLPSILGEPVILVATINGNTHHLVVEDWAEDRGFKSRSLKVSGRGLACELGVPYQPAASGTLENARNLSQAIEEALPLGSGWTLEWSGGAADWLLPSGSVSWVNSSPISRIQQLAQAAGYVVVPHPAARVIRVQPRYAIPPWEFESADTAQFVEADMEPMFIPDSAIIQLTRRQPVPSQANAVYVYGNSQGVIGRAWRTGTAGDRLAPSVQSDVVTDSTAIRAVGTRWLSAQHQQPDIQSLTLPLGGDFPLAHQGGLAVVEFSDGSKVYGIINAVSISSSSATSRQVLTLGEDTPNAWAMWKKLQPEAPLLWGRVVAIHEGGTRSVDLIDGGRIRARGAGSVGGPVWVRSGVIEGEAPDLSALDVEVF